MITTLIPARGGSKRLPGKNIRNFCGSPLLNYSIWAAQKTPALGPCYVTTEDQDIADAAKAAGAEVIVRPPHLSEDDSSTADVLLHAIDVLESRGEDLSPGIALFQPTNPLRPIPWIESAVRRFQEAQCDSLISVTLHQLKTGEVVDGFFEADYRHGTASQDMQERAYENGLLYLTRTSTLRKYRNVAGEKVIGFETPHPFGSVDIDTEMDFRIGEAIFALVKDDLGY